MTVQRPNVVVYEEYRSVTVTPDVPDLNTLIVGPCYQLLDYLDDKADCYAADYGTLDAVCPITTIPAVTLVGPPNAKAGSLLKADSVNIYFDGARAQLTKWDGAPDNATYTAGSNLFVAHTTAAGEDFAANGVLPGDILYAQTSGALNDIKTVKEVLFTLVDFGGTLTFVTQNIAAGDLVVLSNDNPPGGTSRNGTYTVKEVRNETTLVFTGLDWTQNPQTTFSGGNTVDLLITSSTGAVKLTHSAIALANYSELNVTSDFSENSSASYKWRVERPVSNLLIADTNYTITDNQIVIKADIAVDLSSVLTNKTITYARIYVEYAALRTDLQVVNTLYSPSSMDALLGKYDARNPLRVGAEVAKANTTTPITVYGVKEDTLSGYLDFIDKISTVRDTYAIVPLTYTTSTLAALNNMCVNLADPNYALTHGTKQKFRVTIGALELETEKDVVAARSGGSATTSANTAPTTLGNRTLTVTWNAGSTDPVPNFSGSGSDPLSVVPGDIIEVYNGATTVQYTVSSLKASQPSGAPTTNVVEVDRVVTGVTLTTSNTLRVLASNGTTVKALYTVDGTDIVNIVIGSNTLDNLYLIFNATGGSFISSGVIPGDRLEVPTGLTANTWTTYGTWIIDEVISEERVRVVNNSTDTPILANELPHNYNRVTALPVISGTMYYRVVRTLTKDQQVTSMVQTATSFSSKRMLLCYPDSVDVADLIDGSKARSIATTAEAADAQPGYYLACAVGGQTAGLPPQQGFTYAGIAGISRIYNSQEYFKEEQITDLSNGGVYVFIQDNANSLPYSVHEVTTDVSALEFSEYMLTKNFDFVAWTFLDTMQGFVGTWNVLDETIEFVRQACYNTGANLKARKVAKIGAPLKDFKVDSVAISDLSADRIEGYLSVDLPMALNTIGIHLVA
jgi:hypothetical protein